MKARILLGFTALMVAAAMTGLGAPMAAAQPVTRSAAVAAAQPATSEAVSPGISGEHTPSWQTNGIVWSLAYRAGVVYAAGEFTSVRPPGDPLGKGEVARTYLAAFNATTGALIKSFDPSIVNTEEPGGVYALAVSPDGKTLYVGGLFDQVDGVTRDNLAAFSTATGALTSWAPTAYAKVNAIATSHDGSQIYVGGLFEHLDGATRTYAGAVDPDGNLLPWSPVVNGPLYTLAVTSDDSQVLLGGYFQTINGVAQNGAGAVDPSTGQTTEPWGANIVPWNPPKCTSTVKDIVISGSTAYLAAEGNGNGCFDGDFAVGLSLSKGDQLRWQSDCLGATQALAVVRGWLFKGSHAHDCAYAPGGFPQVGPANDCVTWHLLDQSLANGTLGHWTPDTNVGTTDPGVGDLGPHALATNGSRLYVGGDFTQVNGKPQQGFAIFGPGPASTRPVAPAAPRVTSTSAGVAAVAFTAVSTHDVGTLRYSIYRSGRKTPVGTVTATSWPWALPALHYRVTGLRPGSRYTFQVTVGDGVATSAKSPKSAPITISRKNPPRTYEKTVLASKPSFLWTLAQKSGSRAVDASGHHRYGIYVTGTTKGVTGPVPGSSATASWFNGVSGLVRSDKAVTSPATFSIEAWFKTATDSGGKIIGFGNSATGSSTEYDRQIYMMNDGQLVFGVQTSSIATIETPDVYNDNRWHYVVATVKSSGNATYMTLYVDGREIGTLKAGPGITYTGYWRVGGDNLNGWNLDYWKTTSQQATEPASYYFRGSIGDVALYPVALSAKQVAAHYAANARSH